MSDFQRGDQYRIFCDVCYFLLKGRASEAGNSLSSQKVQEKSRLETNPGILKQYCEKNFQELVELLRDKELLEEGYRKRDFALAILDCLSISSTSSSALGGANVQKRQILFSIHPAAETDRLGRIFRS